jgi:hypothetical protein
MREETRDEATGLYLVVQKSCGAWEWIVAGPKFNAAGGKAKSMSAAKGAAVKAVEVHAAKAVTT